MLAAIKFGNLHLLVLHFPIALILSAALADLAWRVTGREFFRAAGFYCIFLAALGSIPTAITGDALLDGMSPEGLQAKIATFHMIGGITTACLAGLAALLRIVRRNKLEKAWGWVYAVVIVLAVLAVSLTAHLGGILAWNSDYLSL